MNRRLRILALVSLASLPAILPFACGQPILRLVTPVLLDGGNPILTRLINLVAPLVLP